MQYLSYPEMNTDPDKERDFEKLFCDHDETDEVL